jgi:hypothetical protein
MYLRGESSFQDYFDYEDLRRGLRTVEYVEFRKLVALGKYDGFGDHGPSTSHMDDYYEGVYKVPGARLGVESGGGADAAHDGRRECADQGKVEGHDCQSGERAAAGRSRRGLTPQLVYCVPHCPNATSSAQEIDWFKKVSYRLKPFEAGTKDISEASIVHFPATLLGKRGR